MNFRYRILLFILLASLGFQGIKAQEPMQTSVSRYLPSFVEGGLLVGSLILGGCAAKAAYIKYLLYTTPKACFEINWRRRNADNPIRISQWYAFDKSLRDFPLAVAEEMRPHEIIACLQSKIAIEVIVEELINACKDGKVALYYANGEIENREKKITYKSILQTLVYEKNRLLEYMNRLDSFTEVPDIYETALQEAQSLNYEEKNKLINERVSTHLKSLNKNQGWAAWFRNSLFRPYQQEIAITYWNLKVSYCWVRVLYACVKHEFDRLNKEQEEQRFAPPGVGRAIRQ